MMRAPDPLTTRVGLRIIALTEEEAEAAIRQLRECIGAARVLFEQPLEGDKGGWLAYGTFEFADPAPVEYPRRRPQ